MRDELSDPCLRDHRSAIGEDDYIPADTVARVPWMRWFEDQMLEGAFEVRSGATDVKQLQPAVCSAVDDTTVLDQQGGEWAKRRGGG